MATRKAAPSKKPTPPKKNAQGSPQETPLHYLPAFFCSSECREPGNSSLTPPVKFWIRHPAEHDFNPERAYCVDLTATPSKYGHCDIDKIAIDDHINGVDKGTDSVAYGYTTLGPCFPHAYGAAGVYLSRTKRDQALRLDTGKKPRAPLEDETVIVKWVAGSKLPVHYHGFYALRPNPNGRGSKFRIVYHPGSAIAYDNKKMQQWRAPRKLWIPDDAIHHIGHNPKKTEKGPPKADPAPESIYLEQDYALYIAELDAPKKPSGSGESAIFPQDARLLPNGPRPPNLNVISAYATGEIKKILEDKLTCYLLVHEGETLSDALARYLNECIRDNNIQQFINLDIIGHSRSRDLILKLGELPLTSRVAESEFSRLYSTGILGRFGIKNIRLLGCRTGCHPRGRRVVKTIRKYFPGCRVYAARGDLFAVHYREDGFLKEAEMLLVDDDVMSETGPGDIPPEDDYRPPLPNDDDDSDDNKDDNHIIGDANVYDNGASDEPPDQFSLSTLSNVNAAAVSAQSYCLWDFLPEKMELLISEIHADLPQNDNPLVRAGCEVIVPISSQPKDTDDFRSFELIRCGKHDRYDKHNPPRVRLQAGGQARAFLFKHPRKVKSLLKKLEIFKYPPQSPPVLPAADHAAKAKGV